MNEALSFEEWYALNEAIISIELAENGSDREMDFNPEKEFEKRYNNYLGNSSEVERAITKIAAIMNDPMAKQLLPEIICFAMRALRNNPGISMEHALDIGCEEWDV